MTVLDRQTIRDLISQKKLVTGLIDPETQVTPNGVELSLHKVYQFTEAGLIDFSNEERHIPQYEEIRQQVIAIILHLEPIWLHIMRRFAYHQTL